MPHDAYFQGNPTRLDVSRSRFGSRPRWSGTWDTGVLVPIFATSSVMPGDTFKISVASAIRMIRPVVPPMDDIDITIEAYFIPHRLVLSRKSMSPDLSDSNHSWAAFIGAQDSLLNMPTPGDIKLPMMSLKEGLYLVGGLGDCLGFPVPQSTGGRYWVNCLKPLAYYSVWNEYFREPNVESPVTFGISSSATPPSGSYLDVYGTDAGVATATTELGNLPLAPVSRYHSYFGSALPWPQRNSAQVGLPLGDAAPVVTGDMHGGVGFDAGVVHPMTFVNQNNVAPDIGSSFYTAGYSWTSGEGVSNSGVGMRANKDSAISPVSSEQLTPNNLWADLSSATAASVNEFRLAVQTQRWYEALARSGNKYSDLVHGMFGVRGVSIPDRPEYLGGFTAPINISQVASTNGVSGGGLGDTGAFSLSNPSGYLFTKSFTEHGTIMIVACCRVRDSFSQGVQREDFRIERFDFYWPQFANLGEQAIEKREIFVDGKSTGSTDKEVFGYQEAWAEYRMFTDRVTGYLNPSALASIKAYTFTNEFGGAPTLKGFLTAKNQANNVDRCLSVDHYSAGFQFFGQFEFDIQMVRPMPTYSIPGLVDHH